MSILPINGKWCKDRNIAYPKFYQDFYWNITTKIKFSFRNCDEYKLVKLTFGESSKKLLVKLTFEGASKKLLVKLTFGDKWTKFSDAKKIKQWWSVFRFFVARSKKNFNFIFKDIKHKRRENFVEGFYFVLNLFSNVGTSLSHYALVDFSFKGTCNSFIKAYGSKTTLYR